MPDGGRSRPPTERRATNDELTRRDRGLLLGVTLTWGACLLYLGLAARLPIVGDVDSSEFAWWGHAFGTMVLTALVYLLVVGQAGRTRRQAMWIALGVAVAGGVLLEVMQAIGGRRDPTIVDVVVDVAGALVAVAVLSWTHVSHRAAARVVAIATAAVLVVAVPVVIFATPEEPSEACGLERIAATDAAARTLSGSESMPAPVAEYRFDEGTGDRVADSAGARPLPLRLSGRTSWIDGGGVHFAGGAARSESPAADVVRAIRSSGEMTAVARVRTSRLDQQGPARIATISSGTAEGQVDVHLGQEGGSLSVRLRATCGSFNWTTVPKVFTSTRAPVDVAVSFVDDTERVYVNGVPAAAWRISGTLRNWNPRYPVVIGNEATRDRPFFGDVFGVLVYDRALTGSAIAEQTAAWRT